MADSHRTLYTQRALLAEQARLLDSHVLIRRLSKTRRVRPTYP